MYAAGGDLSVQIIAAVEYESPTRPAILRGRDPYSGAYLVYQAWPAEDGDETGWVAQVTISRSAQLAADVLDWDNQERLRLATQTVQTPDGAKPAADLKPAPAVLRDPPEDGWEIPEARPTPLPPPVSAEDAEELRRELPPELAKELGL